MLSNVIKCYEVLSIILNRTLIIIISLILILIGDRPSCMIGLQFQMNSTSPPPLLLLSSHHLPPLPFFQSGIPADAVDGATRGAQR